MNWDETFERLLRARLPELDGGTPLRPDTDLRAFGLDSLGTMELVVAIEDDLGVEVPDEALTYETFTTVGSLWAVVDAATRAQEGAA